MGYVLLIVTMATLTFLSYLLYLYFTQQPLKLPGLNGYPILGVAIEWGTNPWKFLVTCEKRFGGAFGLNIAGANIIIAAEKKIARDLFKAPDSRAQSGPAVVESFGLRLFVSDKAINDQSFINVMKTTMSAQLPNFFEPLKELSREFIEKNIGNSNTYLDLLSELCYPLVALVTMRSVCGPEFNSNVKLRNMFIDYNKTAETMMGVGLLLPRFLYPVAKYFIKQDDEDLAEAMLPIIAKRRKQQQRPNDQIDVLQDYIEAGYDDEYILAAIKTTMWAAVMNSASALSHVLNDISYNPEFLVRVVEEQNVVGELSHKSLEKMVYLEACIKESLRMASAPCGAARKTMDEFKYEQGIIPKDSTVLISRYLIHHDEKSWDDPQRYNPKRFLQKSEKQKGAWIPFGGGHHACPGRFYALFAIKLLVAQLVRNYEIMAIGARPPYTVKGNEVRSEKGNLVFSIKSK